MNRGHDNGSTLSDYLPGQYNALSGGKRPMKPHERAKFTAIVDRPPLRLPGRIVVWTIVNLEVWDISRAMARQVLSPPTGQRCCRTS
jgi:hypothetical protein